LTATPQRFFVRSHVLDTMRWTCANANANASASVSASRSRYRMPEAREEEGP